MKKLTIALFLLLSLSVQAIEVIINDGIQNAAIQQKMENTLSALLTEVNAAQQQNRALQFAQLNVPQSVQMSLSMLWENSPFRCIADDDTFIDRCLTTPTGYQIRNIPLRLYPVENREFDPEDYYQQAVVSFSKQGNLESFYLTLNTNLYTNVIQNNTELTDLRRRQLILDFVERFRTSYNTKDIKFLEQIFSEDALIITGKVVQNKEYHQENVIYNVLDKQQYIARLRQVFKANSYIRVTFDEIEVSLHPTLKDFYGVTLHQGYTATNYHDDGYLFLIWDFRDEDHPQITVRTWQPDKINGGKLPKDSIFSLEDFDLGDDL